MNSDDTFDVLVTQARHEANGVLSLRLRGAIPLPAWTAGSHVDLTLPSGLVRQYSLCGDTADPDYTVAVLHEADGRGGSAEIHTTGLVGRRLQIRGPRNRFVLGPATSYVFVAGGIGITPLLAMIRTAVDDGTPWTLHYGGRRADTLAFTEEVQRLAGVSAGAVSLHSDDVDGPLPLAEILAAAPAGAAVYSCGPPGMLRALADVAEASRPELPVRIERFVADPGPDRATDPVADPAGAFEVVMASTGETVPVAAGRSILDAVRTVRPDVMASCEEGFCGTCETQVLDGTPVHRDTILSPRERARGTSMMICVGSCSSPRLVLDL
ncbi:PDR/VanB family oxidoreductase [Pseudonocardia alni]|uniref:PDR/VanB family oxidoreductase n=1 Tax=Pseudonocardia TaxID=1847 RepID=UPI000919616A|nr:2Fe-2S iron-sulfur cluster binding domain-containing protein [Pseudonocardia sp. SID8383]OJG08523.1 Phenoxybenzoate dioxygenase subunit beta [Pseudonocardia autotrophica]